MNVLQGSPYPQQVDKLGNFNLVTIETPQIHSLNANLPTPPGERLWTAALEQTRSRSPASFEQWFSSVQYDGFETGVLSLTARDEFVRDWVKAHFLPDLLGNLAR